MAYTPHRQSITTIEEADRAITMALGPKWAPSSLKSYCSRLQSAISPIDDYLKLVGKAEIRKNAVDSPPPGGAYAIPELESTLNKALVNFVMLSEGITDGLDTLESAFSSLSGTGGSSASQAGPGSDPESTHDRLFNSFCAAGDVLDAIDTAEQLLQVTEIERKRVVSLLSAELESFSSRSSDEAEKETLVQTVHDLLVSVKAERVLIGYTFRLVENVVRQVFWALMRGNPLLGKMFRVFNNRWSACIDDLSLPLPRKEPIREMGWQLNDRVTGQTTE